MAANRMFVEVYDDRLRFYTNNCVELTSAPTGGQFNGLNGAVWDLGVPNVTGNWSIGIGRLSDSDADVVDCLFDGAGNRINISRDFFEPNATAVAGFTTGLAGDVFYMNYRKCGHDLKIVQTDTQGVIVGGYDKMLQPGQFAKYHSDDWFGNGMVARRTIDWVKTGDIEKWVCNANAMIADGGAICCSTVANSYGYNLSATLAVTRQPLCNLYGCIGLNATVTNCIPYSGNLTVALGGYSATFDPTALVFSNDKVTIVNGNIVSVQTTKTNVSVEWCDVPVGSYGFSASIGTVALNHCLSNLEVVNASLTAVNTTNDLFIVEIHENELVFRQKNGDVVLVTDSRTGTGFENQYGQYEGRSTQLCKWSRLNSSAVIADTQHRNGNFAVVIGNTSAAHVNVVDTLSHVSNIDATLLGARHGFFEPNAAAALFTANARIIYANVRNCKDDAVKNAVVGLSTNEGQYTGTNFVVPPGNFIIAECCDWYREDYALPVSVSACSTSWTDFTSCALGWTQSMHGYSYMEFGNNFISNVVQTCCHGNNGVICVNMNAVVVPNANLAVSTVTLWGGDCYNTNMGSVALLDDCNCTCNFASCSYVCFNNLPHGNYQFGVTLNNGVQDIACDVTNVPEGQVVQENGPSFVVVEMDHRQIKVRNSTAYWNGTVTGNAGLVSNAYLTNSNAYSLSIWNSASQSIQTAQYIVGMECVSSRNLSVVYNIYDSSNVAVCSSAAGNWLATNVNDGLLGSESTLIYANFSNCEPVYVQCVNSSGVLVGTKYCLQPCEYIEFSSCDLFWNRSEYPEISANSQVDVAVGSLQIGEYVCPSSNSFPLVPSAIKQFNASTPWFNSSVRGLPSKMRATATVSNLKCGFTNNTGVITFTSATGGVAPYQYSINGSSQYALDGTYSNATTYAGLTEGVYNLSVKDNSGCVLFMNSLTVGPASPVINGLSYIVEIYDDYLRCRDTKGNDFIYNAMVHSGSYAGYTNPTRFSEGIVPMNNKLWAVGVGGVTSPNTADVVDCLFHDLYGSSGTLIRLAPEFDPAGPSSQHGCKLGPDGYFEPTQADNVILPGSTVYYVNCRQNDYARVVSTDTMGRIYPAPSLPLFDQLLRPGQYMSVTAADWWDVNKSQVAFTLPTYGWCNVLKNRFGLAEDCIVKKDFTIDDPWHLMVMNATCADKDGMILVNSAAINGITVSNCTVDITLCNVNGTPLRNYQKLENTSFKCVQSGTYYLCAKDQYGCTMRSANPVVVYKQNCVSVNLVPCTTVNASCYEVNDGKVNIVVAGGSPTYTVYYDGNVAMSVPAGTSYQLTGLGAGMHKIFVQDSNLPPNTAFTSVRIYEDVVRMNNLKCVDRFIDPTLMSFEYNLSVTGGKSPYAWTLSNSTSNIVPVTNTATGSYNSGVINQTHPSTLQIMVMDACGRKLCKSIGAHTDLDVSVTVNDIRCFGQNGNAVVVIDGGFAPYTIDVSTGMLPYMGWGNIHLPGNYPHTVIVTNLNASVDTITVTDSNGAATNLCVEFVEPDLLGLQLIKSRPAANPCANGVDEIWTLLSDGGVPNADGGYNLFIDGVASGSTVACSQITGLTSGNHNAVIVDSYGCTNTRVFTVSLIDELCLTMEVMNPSGFGKNDGSIMLTATGGTAPYHWGNLWVSALNAWVVPTVSGASSETAIYTGLPTGVYDGESLSALVSDANCYEACNDCVPTVTLTSPPELLVDVDALSQWVGPCAGPCDGQLTFTISGGVGPYVYAIVDVDTQELYKSALVVNAGSVTVICVPVERDLELTVVDVKGNRNAQTVRILRDNSLDVNINIDLTGTMTIATSTVQHHGTAYTYRVLRCSTLVASGALPGTVNELDEGVYEVTVIDAYGCEQDFVCESGKSLHQLCAELVKGDLVCKNDAIYQNVTLNINGGSEQYVVVIDNGVPQFIEGHSLELCFEQGTTHTIIVYDRNICCLAIEKEVTTDVLEELTLTVTKTFTSISAVVTGGATPYTWKWYRWVNNAWCYISNAPNQLTGLSAGKYKVVVCDACGDVVEQEVTLDVEFSLNVELDCFDPSCGLFNGSISANISGGKAPYQYAWQLLSVGSGDPVVEDILVRMLARIRGPVANNLRGGVYQLCVTDATATTVCASCTLNEQLPVALECSSGVSEDLTQGLLLVNVLNSSSYVLTVDNQPVVFDPSNTYSLAVSFGTHHVKAVDLVTQCVAECDIDICQSERRLPQSVAKSPTRCSDFVFDDSSQTAVRVRGGQAPYTIYKDGELVNAVDGVIHLTLGEEAEVTVCDAHGCVAEYKQKRPPMPLRASMCAPVMVGSHFLIKFYSNYEDAVFVCKSAKEVDGEMVFKTGSHVVNCSHNGQSIQVKFVLTSSGKVCGQKVFQDTGKYEE